MFSIIAKNLKPEIWMSKYSLVLPFYDTSAHTHVDGVVKEESLLEYFVLLPCARGLWWQQV